MAELSPDSQAIVDRLKSEGNLVRNSGTHSIRSVKIQLDKFEEIFKTISNNISLQNDVLKIQTDIVKADAKNSEEESERARAADEFEKLEPQDRSDRDDGERSKLVTDEEKTKIDSIGDSIASALSFKNIALAGAGLFVGYNLLKGFIDEKTGGGFTEFEKNIGPFAKSLPIIGKVLTDFPGTLAEMRTSIQTMSTSVTDFVTDLRETIEKFSTIGGVLSFIWDNLSELTIVVLGLKALLLKLANDRLKLQRTPGAGVPGTTDKPKAGGSKVGSILRGVGSIASRATIPLLIATTVGKLAYDSVQDKKEFDNLEAREAAGEKLTQEESVRRNELNQMFNQDMSNPEAYMFENLEPKKTKPPVVDTTPMTDPEAYLVQNRNITSSVGGGRGVIIEKPGERAAYMQNLADREKIRLEEITKNATGITESISNDNANRKNGLNTISNSGGGGSAVIINAPVSAPSSVNVSNGGSSVNQLSISGGGGGSLGPSMLPYGLTNAFS